MPGEGRATPLPLTQTLVHKEGGGWDLGAVTWTAHPGGGEKCEGPEVLCLPHTQTLVHEREGGGPGGADVGRSLAAKDPLLLGTRWAVLVACKGELESLLPTPGLMPPPWVLVGGGDGMSRGGGSHPPSCPHLCPPGLWEEDLSRGKVGGGDPATCPHQCPPSRQELERFGEVVGRGAPSISPPLHPCADIPGFVWAGGGWLML